MSNALVKPKEFEAFLESRSTDIRKALGPDVDIDRYIHAVKLCLVRNEFLQKCSKTSIYMSTLEAAQTKLTPDPTLGEAYLIPRYNGKKKEWECNFQPGYRGYVKLMMQSGHVKSVNAYPVFKANQDGGEHFQFSAGTRPGIEHFPSLDEDYKDQDLTHVYCVIEMSTGGQVVKVLKRSEVEAAHQRSANYISSKKKGYKESGPWVSDYVAMALKTAVRAARKMVPFSTDELLNADAADNRQYEIENSQEPRALTTDVFESDMVGRNKAIEAEDRKNAETHEILDAVDEPETPREAKTRGMGRQRLFDEFEKTVADKKIPEEGLADILAAAELNGYSVETPSSKLMKLCELAKAY